ncbi:MAG: hypothetical protein JWR84_2478 [Caulobacter sp.]|nr:hypothetical protein [Caulobacter sp.]
MKPASLIALALSLLLASSAIAAPPASEEARLAANPMDSDLMDAFPEKARGQNIMAQVTMRCTIDAAGKARRCETLKEDPYGLGFGEAGTGLMERKGRFKPRRIDGQAVDGGQVEVSVHIWPRPGRKASPLLHSEPVWASVASFEDMAAAWPAGQPGDEAVVVLRCTMRSAGDLKNCLAINGAEKASVDAARSLSDRFRVRLTRDEASFYAGWDVILSLRLLNPAGPAAADRRVTAPDWTTFPDERALQAVYPARAASAGIRSGRGVADCLVAADGSLTDCRVAGERPDSLGFGEASLQVASQMKLGLWSADGRPTVGSRIRLPIDFNQAAR